MCALGIGGIVVLAIVAVPLSAGLAWVVLALLVALLALMLLFGLRSRGSLGPGV
jgi:hypothetical protein